MSGPYVFDPTVPDGAVHLIEDGDDQFRADKGVLLSAFQQGPLEDFPTSARGSLGWPRILSVTLKSGLPAASPPYGRLAYAADQDHLYVETAAGWKNAYPAGAKTLPCITGLTGDGFLASPNLCGTQVFDWYDRITYRGVFAGPDFPCSVSAFYRALFRFPIDPGPRHEIASVTFNVYLAEIQGAIANCLVLGIADFGTLDFGDLFPTILVNYGALATPASAIGWKTVDVTSLYLAQKAAAASHIAFQLAVEFEGIPSTVSRWYGFVAADNPGGVATPRLVTVFNA